MDVVADRVDHALDRLRGQLRAFAIGEHQLGAVGVEAGRAAFVHFDMGFAVADHAAVGRDHGGKCEAIGCRAGGNP